MVTLPQNTLGQYLTLTSLQVDFHAKVSLIRVKEEDWQTNEVNCMSKFLILPK